MSERGIVWRRFTTKLRVIKRCKLFKSIGWNYKKIGQLRKNNFSCNKPCCKPWKYKLESKLRPNERRRVQKNKW